MNTHFFIRYILDRAKENAGALISRFNNLTKKSMSMDNKLFIAASHITDVLE